MGFDPSYEGASPETNASSLAHSTWRNNSPTLSGKKVAMKGEEVVRAMAGLGLDGRDPKLGELRYRTPFLDPKACGFDLGP